MIARGCKFAIVCNHINYYTNNYITLLFIGLRNILVQTTDSTVVYLL